MCGIEG
ncbi:hypothetical protein LINPERPRIM_LOCUS45329 [Linum perenne]